MEGPLFSIITVTYNAASVIEPTLASIKSQTCQDYEYLVVDGASRDETVQKVNIAEIANTRVISEPDKGLYDAMNKSIANAKGKYLIFLNAGDAFASENVMARLSAAADGDPDIIYGQTQLVDSKRVVLGMRHLTAPEVLTADSFKQGMLVCHQAFVAKKAIVGEYDLSYRFSADYDWCIRCLKASKSNAYVGDTPIISFLTDGLTDKNQKASLKERYAIMCKYYGTVPTIFRHLKFVPRFLAEKYRKSKMKQE